jgi:hypothetical protein
VAETYNIPARKAAINEIRRRLIEQNQSSHQIMAELHLPERTFRRYRTAALKPLIQRLAAIDHQQLVEQSAILLARVESSLERMTALATDKDLDPKQRDSMIQAEREVLRLASFLLEVAKEAEARNNNNNNNNNNTKDDFAVGGNWTDERYEEWKEQTEQLKNISPVERQKFIREKNNNKNNQEKIL